jgi:hypothetical protein
MSFDSKGNFIDDEKKSLSSSSAVALQNKDQLAGTSALRSAMGSGAVDLATGIGEKGPQPSPFKRLHVTIGAQDWMARFDSKNEFFAPGIVLTLDQEVKVTANTEYEAVLANMMKKFQDSTPGKLISGLQKMSSAMSGIATGAEIANPNNTKLQGLKGGIGMFPPNARYQTTLSNLPAWKSTEPLHISEITFKFQMGMAGVYDGRREVWNPVIALSTVNLPSVYKGSMLIGPLPSASYVYGQIAGAVASDVLAAAKQVAASVMSGSDAPADVQFEQKMNNLMGKVEDDMWKILGGDHGGIVQIGVGKRLLLPPFTVKTTSYKFSTDTDDHGFPVSGEVTWSGIDTLEVANTGMSAYRLYKENE